MATYNFTVRATDNSGAFADRNFAMTVNNTQVDRFVAVGASGLARSQDGINWTAEQTLTGHNVRWDNNQWIVTHLVGSTSPATPVDTIRTSIDGVNWRSFSGKFASHRVAYSNPSTFASSGTAVIKYRKGSYVMFSSVLAATTLSVDEFNSTDLINWNGVRQVLSYNNTSNYFDGVWDFEYDPVSDTWIVLGSYAGGVFAFRRIGNGGWVNISASLSGLNNTIPLNATSSPPTSRYMGKVFFQNGLWIVANGQTGVWTSVDAQNWVFRDTGPISAYGIGGICYSNGRLLLSPMSTAASGAPLLQSLNAGHTWAARTIVSGTSANYSSVPLTGTYNTIDTYAGTTITVSPGRLNIISATKDDGLNWIGVNPGIGGIYSIAARNT